MDDVKTKKIVVVGVSDRPEKYGYKIFKGLIEAGFDVQGINPRDGEILGRKVFKNLKELKSLPDMDAAGL
ncbi:MAG: CoA-binding protein [Candidatus Omnitrophica bacterium]|nr:CoA-binding protein [Candidatus Omnitrophota bacterium]